MSTHISMPFTDYFPPNVLDFATRRKLADLLDPLRLALDRLFPAAQSVCVRLEEDPEIRDDYHLVFDVRGVRHVMVTQYLSAMRRREIGAHVADLTTEASTIVNALDCLFKGV